MNNSHSTNRTASSEVYVPDNDVVVVEKGEENDDDDDDDDNSVPEGEICFRNQRTNRTLNSLRSSGGLDTEAANNALLQEVSTGRGLLFQLNSDEGSVSMDAVLNQCYPSIHPNCHAPACLTNVRLLYGGGSGTAVFGGDHPTLNAIVMKHAGPKDAREVFSLASITEELLNRRVLSELASADMSRRISSFAMVYISPYHLRDRAKELWFSLRTVAYTPSGRRKSLTMPNGGPPKLTTASSTPSTSSSTESSNTALKTADNPVPPPLPPPLSSRSFSNSDHARLSNLSPVPTIIRGNVANANAQQHPHPLLTRTNSPGVAMSAPLAGRAHPRNIRVLCSKLNSISMRELHEGNQEILWKVRRSKVEIVLPFDWTSMPGTAFMREFGKALETQLERNNWKVTIGQKWIGGPNAVNGADVLTSGNLNGALLETLIREFSAVMHDLDQLTFPHEKIGRYALVVEQIQPILQQHAEASNSSSSSGGDSPDVRTIPKMVDDFCGKSISKNFHPDHGRFHNMRMWGQDFYSSDDNQDGSNGQFFRMLTPTERLPARFLSRLLTYGTDMNQLFVDAPSQRSALDVMEDRGWIDILQSATQFSTDESDENVAATECLWTCGLTDAGLHNSFLSIDRGLELFDLGEPGLQPRPAFLIKFLMSFFHTLGMEWSSESSTWKVLFEIIDDNDYRLSLSSETKEKIPYLCEVFTVAMNHCIDHVFHGNERVRKLLIKYIVLQLLSDASFCLQRWESKGGGTQRLEDGNKLGLEKWLWRSLWDHFVASYVHTHFRVGEGES